MDNRDSIDRSSSELGANTLTNGALRTGAGLGDSGDGYAVPPTAASTNDSLQVVEDLLQSDVRSKQRVLWWRRVRCLLRS